jgi:outer membrane protein assembly factor BamE (lipoprotein component of BamABCDE complex)
MVSRHDTEGLRPGETATGSPWGGTRPKRSKERKMWPIILLVAAVLIVVPSCIAGICAGPTLLLNLMADPIDEAAFARLHAGMTTEEVYEIIGTPTLKEFDITEKYDFVKHRNQPRIEPTGWCSWIQTDNEITVVFQSGKAKEIHGTFKDPKTGEIRHR